jgi:hypothetical protein
MAAPRRRPALPEIAIGGMPEAPAAGSRRMPPIALTDAQLTAVFEAARPLPRESRDAFLVEVATALQTLVDPGDGDVARAIRAVQRKHFDPPELSRHSVPHRRLMAKAR